LRSLTSEHFYNTYVKLPTSDTPAAEHIRLDKRFFPYFKNCLGAIDGTHVLAFTPELDHSRYRNRKGQVSQNVLAACSMDMSFVYCLPGWEGSAADSRIYEDARSKDLMIPKGKYYLADAGFPACDALLVPYQGVRYHLKEWGKYGEECVCHNSACRFCADWYLGHKMLKSSSTCTMPKLGMLLRGSLGC